MFLFVKIFLETEKKTSCVENIGFLGLYGKEQGSSNFRDRTKWMVPFEFSMTQSIRKCTESSFTFQNRFFKKIGTSRKLFWKKMELHEFKKKAKWMLFKYIFWSSLPFSSIWT